MKDIQINKDKEIEFLKERIGELERSEAERKEAEKLLHIQRDLGLALSVISDLTECHRISLEMAITVSGMDSGGIYLVDKSDGAFNLVYHQGLPESFVRAAAHFKADSEQAKIVMRGEPIYTMHQELGVLLSEDERKEALGALVIIPMKSEDNIIGYLNVASHHVNQIADHLRGPLETIAVQIGNVVTRLQAQEEIRQRLKELEIFHDATVDRERMMEEMRNKTT